MPSIRSLILAFLVLLLTIFTTTTTAYKAKLWTNDDCTGDLYQINWYSDDTCRDLDCANEFPLDMNLVEFDDDSYDGVCPSLNKSRPIYSIEYESDNGCMLALFTDKECHESYTVTNHQLKCLSPGYRIWGMSCG